MSSQEKKRKTKDLSETPNPSLTYDLLLNCLARVSRLYYPTLSLVSKSFQSLLASPDLYKVRTLLGHTEICLYVCMYLGSDRNPKWFTLSRKPYQTLTNDTNNKKKYVLARVLIPHSPPVNNWGHGLVAVGSSIYNIGGSKFSTIVSVMDCKFHTWSEAPSYRVKLRSLTASVVDQKIYVAGCYDEVPSYSSKESIEVLDTETQIWEPLPVPFSEGMNNYYSKSACIDGMFHLDIGNEYVAYKSEEGRWDLTKGWMVNDTYSYSFCTIENVVIYVSFGNFEWYDTKENMWGDLLGLKRLPKFPYGARVRMANYGGKMAVLWNEDSSCSRGHQTMVWCAIIAIERRKRGEIWGEVEWFDHVLTIPGECVIVNVLAVTV